MGSSNYAEQSEKEKPGKFYDAEGDWDSDSFTFFDDDDTDPLFVKTSELELEPPEPFVADPTIEPMPEPDMSEHFDEKGETEGISLDPIMDVLEKSNTIDSHEGDLIAISDPSVTDTTADVAFYDPAPITVDLEESVDEDDWEEPEDRLDKGDRDDEEKEDDEDDEED